MKRLLNYSPTITATDLAIRAVAATGVTVVGARQWLAALEESDPTADNHQYKIAVLTVPAGEGRLIFGMPVPGGYTGCRVAAGSRTAQPTTETRLPFTDSASSGHNASIRFVVEDVFRRAAPVNYDDNDQRLDAFRRQLQVVLDSYGEPAVQSVGHLVKRHKTDPELAFAALQLLAEEFPSLPSTLATAVDALNIDDLEVRFGAALALTQLRDARAGDAIRSAFARELSSVVKNQLQKALQTIAA
jgi:hypothetical protein